MASPLRVLPRGEDIEAPLFADLFSQRPAEGVVAPAAACRRGVGLAICRGHWERHVVAARAAACRRGAGLATRRGHWKRHVVAARPGSSFVPFWAVISSETRVQLPTSCCLSVPCWATMLRGSMANPSAAIADNLKKNASSVHCGPPCVRFVAVDRSVIPTAAGRKRIWPVRSWESRSSCSAPKKFKKWRDGLLAKIAPATSNAVCATLELGRLPMALLLPVCPSGHSARPAGSLRSNLTRISCGSERAVMLLALPGIAREAAIMAAIADGKRTLATLATVPRHRAASRGLQSPSAAPRLEGKDRTLGACYPSSIGLPRMASHGRGR